MKVAGRRIGPTEIEACVMQVPGVSAAVAVPLRDDRKGHVVVVLMQVNAETRLAEAPREVTETVAHALGRPMRPAAVRIVSALPLTLSGKIHRRVIRAWINGDDPGDLSTVEKLESSSEILRIGDELRHGAIEEIL
jgi:acyl-coenzyme A synthetase/AMP-(fatty) acid ligase